MVESIEVILALFVGGLSGIDLDLKVGISFRPMRSAVMRVTPSLLHQSHGL